jgi:hypothetical protein
MVKHRNCSDRSFTFEAFGGRCGIISLLAFLGLAWCSSMRGVHADDFAPPSNLRIGVKHLSDGSEIVFLGTTNPNLPTKVSSQLDQLGVQVQDGKTSNDFEPHFMILKNSQGIQEVYSLFLSGAGELKSSAKLYDSQSIAKDAVKGSIPKIPSVVLGSFLSSQLKALADAISPIVGRKELLRHQQAQELADLFADTLNSYDDITKHVYGAKQLNPELLKIFSTDEMNNSYDDIARRYSPYVAGGFLKRDPSRAAVSRQRLADQNDSQQIPITAFANQEGYLRFPMGRFSMLAFDCANLQSSAESVKEQRDNHGYDINDIKNELFSDRCKALPKTGAQYIPFAIYSTEQTKVSAQIIDFANPSKLKDKRFLLMAESLAETALSGVGGSGYGVEIVDDLYKDRQTRHGSTLYDVDTDDAYSQLRGVAEAGGIHLDGPITNPNDAARLDTTLFMIDLAKMKGIPAPEIRQIQSGFASKDMSIWDRSFQTSLDYIAADQGGMGVVNPRSGAQKINRDRATTGKNVSELMNRLQDPQTLSKLGDDMSSRATQESQSVQSLPKKPLTPKQIQEQQRFQANLAQAYSEGKCASVSAVVEFQIDGLKPENLALAAQRGLLPTLKDKVIDHGVQFNSFVTNTVSTSSWSTIRSGKPEDETVITGSSCFASRDPKVNDNNCLDFRGDYSLKSGYTEETVGGSRIYKAIKQTGNDIFPNSLTQDQILTDVSPVHGGANVNPKAVAKSGADYGKDTLYADGTASGANLLDGGNTEAFSEAIKAHPCQFREVQIWLGSVDEDSHTSPRSLDRTYQRIDEDVKKLLDTMANDPVLKNAKIVVDSDHGLSGGVEQPDPTREIMPDKTIFMKDTSRNYSHCFAGNCKGWEDFDFVVGSLVPDEAKRGGTASILNRTIFKPFNFTYKGEPGHENQGRDGYKDHRTLLAESYGNQMEAFYFLCSGVKVGETCANKDTSKRVNYFDMTQYQNDQGKKLNVIDRLLGDQVQNTVVDDNPTLKKDLYNKTQNRPVAFVAIPLQGDVVKKSAAALAGIPTDGLRDPVLIRSYKDKASMILTRDTPSGPEYRYLVLSHFDQDAETGRIASSTQVVTGVEKDPLGYKEDISGWHNKHDWLNRMQNAEYPTAIFALSRNLTLDPRLAGDSQYQARIPDMLAYSNEGFDFNPDQNNLGNHGALRHEIAHNTLYMSGCSVAAQVPTPVLGEQIGQTIKEILGDSNPGTDSLNAAFNAACTAAENSSSSDIQTKVAPVQNTTGEAISSPVSATKAK